MVRHRIERWGDFASAKAIEASNAFDDAGLLRALEALFDELAKDDATQGRGGKRESNAFEIYDCGLASIAEVLRDRAEAGRRP